MEKTLKVNIPDGYEIDRVKSTFENIVFKKKELVVKWNDACVGVEITDEGERFVISALPSFWMTPFEAEMYFADNKEWSLPTKRQCRIISKHIESINDLITSRHYYILRYHLLGRNGYLDYFLWDLYIPDSIPTCKNYLSCQVRKVRNLK